ncbi:TIGR04211 family SH3 domain-containing protein [Hahella ganghwensis]|uniref:TIGR04211 family SH3 domain-containing protein n=1 Tax=Hahella ganghwensis TaxID=286420 RepID=UPI00037BC309|nr:TIGR04211 family SH3 domain-containing protein [Hahella ganghwensis]
MNKVLRFTINILLLATASALSLNSQAETRYIDDTLYAPLRSGEGLEFRVVHKGVKSGTPVELLGTNPGSGYSKVRTPDGIEGYIPTRFLINEPVAADKLARLAKEHEALKAKFAEISQSNNEISQTSGQVQADNERLRAENLRFQEELSNIKRISENAITLDRRNRELRETNEQLKNEVEVLTADNIRLKENNERDKMLLGAGLVLLGACIALVAPMFKRDKRNSW